MIHAILGVIVGLLGVWLVGRVRARSSARSELDARNDVAAAADAGRQAAAGAVRSAVAEAAQAQSDLEAATIRAAELDDARRIAADRARTDATAERVGDDEALARESQDNTARLEDARARLQRALRGGSR